MKEFYDNTYAKEIDCTVLNVNVTETALEVYTDKTICYPECGGQPGDIGTLGQYKILDTKKADNGDSIHILPKDADIAVGQELKMVLNWEHRHKFMVMHTAQHMLSGLLFNMFNIGTVSVHLGDDYLTIETNQENINPEIINQLVTAANDKIAETHKIIYHEMSHSDAEALGMRRSIKVDGYVRIVEIEGVDRIACGGVHVASTSELRLIIYLGQQKIREHVRLFFVCGKDAQTHVFENIKTLDNLKKLLDCSAYSEIVPKVEKNNLLLDEYKQKINAISELIAVSEINDHKQNDIASYETRLDLEAVIKASNRFEELALCAVCGTNWVIILKGKYQATDFNMIREKILIPNGAKGGGKNGFYRGSCSKNIAPEFRKLFLD